MILKRLNCCRKVNSLSDLWVSTHEKLSDFSASAWQRGDSPIPMLMLRLLLLAVTLFIILWSIYEAPSLHWLLYLTNWGMVLLAIMFTCGVCVCVVAIKDKPTDDGGGPLPTTYQAYWFMYNVAVSLALLISTLYWLLLYNPEILAQGPRRLFWLDLSTHGTNTLLASIEVFASRTPLHAAHAYQPLCVGLWYAFFTFVYYVLGGKDGNGYPFIYELTDWRHGKRTLAVVVMASCVLMFIYFLVYWAVLSRDKITTSLFRCSTAPLAVRAGAGHRAGPGTQQTEETLYYEPEEYV